MGRTKATWMKELGLRPHADEGGYYSEVYTSPHVFAPEPGLGDGRPVMSTIYYMLTDDSPRGRLHRNRADIVHFFHDGGPLKYTVIGSDGSVTEVTLGPDPAAGHRLHLVVGGGCWKASQLMGGTFGLISEAVCPGFVPEEREVAGADDLRRLFGTVPQDLLELTAPVGHGTSA